jgi:hypothetical protein
VVAFVPGAFQDISTATSFTANTYTLFSFASTITLQANTWYCAGLAISSYTSGALTFNNSQTNSWFASMKWPQSGYRAPGGTGAFQTAGNYGVGFNNGTSTQMLFGFLHDAATGLAIYTNSTTNTQVGFRFELNLPVDDIFINKILIGQTSINTTQSVVLKIYSDIAGSKLIGSSTVINSTNLVTGALVRPRYYFFAPPVRVKPYKQYFAMMEIVAGTATTSGTSFMSMIGIENRDYYPYDSNNIVAYRANLANANFTYNTGFIAPAIIHYNVSKKAPRPKSSNM